MLYHVGMTRKGEVRGGVRGPRASEHDIRSAEMLRSVSNEVLIGMVAGS